MLMFALYAFMAVSVAASSDQIDDTIGLRRSLSEMKPISRKAPKDMIESVIFGHGIRYYYDRPVAASEQHLRETFSKDGSYSALDVFIPYAGKYKFSDGKICVLPDNADQYPLKKCRMVLLDNNNRIWMELPDVSASYFVRPTFSDKY